MKPEPKAALDKSTSKEEDPVAELPDSGIVLTDMSLQPLAFDTGAAGILRWVGGDGHVPAEAPPPIPPQILEAIRRQTPAEGGGMVVSLQVGNRRYRCRSYVAEMQNPALTPSVVVVHLDSDWDSGGAIRHLATEHHLTDREEEALRGIAHGLTTKELADRMKISPNTVKSFVRLIMIKLGVTTRTAIIVKLLEKSDGM